MNQQSARNRSQWVRPFGRIQRPEQIAFKTRWHGPLHDATSRQRGLLFCELCEVGYLLQDCQTFGQRMLDLQMISVQEHQGAWSARFENQHDIVLVFRAREPVHWRTFVAEQALAAADGDDLGRVLSGLVEPVDAFWNAWENDLGRESSRRLWFCGHSLGGAMALLCANRCLISPIHVEPQEVHTFGVPRTGDHAFRNHSRIRHIRWVRDNDPVPQLPPAWSGFVHVGEETRLNLAGRQLLLGRWDRFMMWVEEIQRAARPTASKHWPLDEHSIENYVETLWEAVLREEETKR